MNFFSLSLQNGCSISLDMTTIRPSKHQSNDQHRWKLIFWVIHGPTNATLSLTRRTWHSLTLPCSLENPFFPSFLEAGGTTLIKLEYPMSPPFFCKMLNVDIRLLKTTIWKKDLHVHFLVNNYVWWFSTERGMLRSIFQINCLIMIYFCFQKQGLILWFILWGKSSVCIIACFLKIIHDSCRQKEDVYRNAWFQKMSPKTIVCPSVSSTNYIWLYLETPY